VIIATLQEKVPPGTMTLGLETGPLSPWPVHALRQAAFSVVGLDARAARAALAMRVNNNDQNDAEGLAPILRLGGYRPAHGKSDGAHQVGATLGARAQLVGSVVRLANQVRGILKVFGIVVVGVSGASRNSRACHRRFYPISIKPQRQPLPRAGLVRRQRLST
jgi:transposase